MKQTRSLSEFSRPSEFTRLYLRGHCPTGQLGMKIALKNYHTNAICTNNLSTCIGRISEYLACFYFGSFFQLNFSNNNLTSTMSAKQFGSKSGLKFLSGSFLVQAVGRHWRVKKQSQPLAKDHHGG